MDAGFEGWGVSSQQKEGARFTPSLQQFHTHFLRTSRAPGIMPSPNGVPGPECSTAKMQFILKIKT